MDRYDPCEQNVAVYSFYRGYDNHGYYGDRDDGRRDICDRVVKIPDHKPRYGKQYCSDEQWNVQQSPPWGSSVLGEGFRTQQPQQVDEVSTILRD